MAQGYLCAGVGTALFAMKGVAVKLLYVEQLDALTVLAWRMILSLPCFLIIGLWLWSSRTPQQRAVVRQPRHFGLAMLCGILSYYISSYLDFKGLETVSAQLERLTLYTYPFFVLFFSAVMIGARVSQIAIIALIVSYLGIGLIFWHEMPSTGSIYGIGTAYVMGAALAYSFQQVISKGVITQVGSRLFTCISMVAASVVMLAHFALVRPIASLAISGHALLLLIVLALFCTVIPTFMLNEAVRRIGPQHTSSVGGVGPVVTIVAAVIILDEPFTLWHVAGTALVLLGVWLFTRHKA